IIFKFQSFLSFLGIAVPAIAGIMWCEYYFIQGRTYKHREGINSKLGNKGLIFHLITSLSLHFIPLIPNTPNCGNIFFFWCHSRK
ncbi:hypothetical protein ACTPEM_22735, partial [Clostridioides difficile]